MTRKTGRRGFLLGATGALASLSALSGGSGNAGQESSPVDQQRSQESMISTLPIVPDPVNIEFLVQYREQAPIRLLGHYWYSLEASQKGEKLPAIIEFNPYRRRDGTLPVDSKMYPYFASQGYLCLRVDLHGSGDSEGILRDEYTEEELSYCIQVVNQFSSNDLCDGNIGMMGESWSAINSLMVASHVDCPSSLKAIIVNCGSDDRYRDDVHYMGGAMMMDNAGWASSMWCWLSQPPDPIVVGENRWKRMWRERIENADFWFEPWGTHQKRDPYWSLTSVRGDYSKVKVPVLIMSGWEDGYKNPVDEVVRGLAHINGHVEGLIGPWGHKYPFSGNPGPRINWLPYAVSHWWDKWLKGVQPAESTSLSKLTVWLGESREPGHETGFIDKGRWISEDADWPKRVKPMRYYLSPHHLLSDSLSSETEVVVSGQDLVFATNMLESSSFGSDGNNDLPGDQDQAEKQSLYFETASLEGDLDCFGYPMVQLTLACSAPVTTLAVRLSEISPYTSKSHQVGYTLFNLAHRDGDASTPRELEPGETFSVSIPLNLIGHTFKKGWRIRLSISPSFFPILWQSPDQASVTLRVGRFAGFQSSSLTLPSREQRLLDNQMNGILRPSLPVLTVNTDDYALAKELRSPMNSREAVRRVEKGRKLWKVIKLMDNGRYEYALNGVLQGLLVDQVMRENFEMAEDDPLSYRCYTSSETVLARESQGWAIDTKTSTEISSYREDSGKLYFAYRATIQASIRGRNGVIEPFAQRLVTGTVPRTWV